MTLECNCNGGSRAIPVLGYNQICLASSRRFSLISIFTMQKNYYISVLFDRTRFAKVRKQWPFIGTLLGASVELGEGDDGDF